MTNPTTTRLPLFLLLPIALFAIIAGPASIVRAQDGTTEQLWVDYHSHYFANESWEWYADGGGRVLAGEFSWAQIYVRPSLRYHRHKHFDVHVGLGTFYTYSEDIADVLEIRPWQGIKFRWPVVGKLVFSHYFRLEERLFFDTENWESSFVLRPRYKLSTRIPLKRAIRYAQFDPLYMPVSAEMFFDFGSTVEHLLRNQARFDIGLGYTFSDDWVGEFHFIIQRSQSGEATELTTSDFIFRFQIKHLRSSKDYRKQQEDLPD